MVAVWEPWLWVPWCIRPNVDGGRPRFRTDEPLMGREVEFSRVERTFQELEYPIARGSAAGQLADVRLILADGEANLGELITASAIDEFESPADLISALHNTLPRAAVGEPFQSEGDA